MYWPFLYAFSDEQKDIWFAGSKTHMYLKLSSTWIDGFIPKDAAEDVKDGVEVIKENSPTRQKLEDLDLLKSKDDGRNTNESDKDGYSPEFRNNMNKMFENSVDRTLND